MCVTHCTYYCRKIRSFCAVLRVISVGECASHIIPITFCDTQSQSLFLMITKNKRDIKYVKCCTMTKGVFDKIEI